PGRSEARATGALWMAGAGLVALSLVLPHPDGADTGALIATAAAMLVIGAAYFGLSRRAPLALTYVMLAGVIAVTPLLTAESGIAAGQYGTIYVWAMLITAYFFSRQVAFAYLGWLLLTYAISLTLVESTAGYSPLTRWLFTAISLSVVVALISSIVASRDR